MTAVTATLQVVRAPTLPAFLVVDPDPWCFCFSILPVSKSTFQSSGQRSAYMIGVSVTKWTLTPDLDHGTR